MTSQDTDADGRLKLRAVNIAILLLSLLAIVPVGFLALVMIEFLSERGKGPGTISNIALLGWSLAATTVAALHTILSARGLFRPKRAGTKRMVVFSVLMFLSCPLLWAILFG